MSYCENDATFNTLYLQMNASLQYIKSICVKYLQTRENKTMDEMKDTWKLLNLEIRNPRRKEVSFDNELHQKMHDFYLNLHNFNQLASFAHEDTTKNRTSIEHGEEISINVILETFEKLKNEIRNNMGEAERVLEALSIPKPDLDENENIVEFNRTHARKLRDFLIIKEFIEDVETVRDFLSNFCETNNNGVGSDGEDQ